MAPLEPEFSLIYHLHPWDLRRMTWPQINRYLDAIPKQ